MINGKLLKDAMMSAAISIANKKRSVDELNVYPDRTALTFTLVPVESSALPQFFIAAILAAPQNLLIAR